MTNEEGQMDTSLYDAQIRVRTPIGQKSLVLLLMVQNLDGTYHRVRKKRPRTC